VPDTQKTLYDEITSTVWDKPILPEGVFFTYNPEADILRFRELLCPLVETFATTAQRLDRPVFGGQGLRAIHQQYSQMEVRQSAQLDQNEPAILFPADGEHKDWNEERSRRIPLRDSPDLSTDLVWLVSGPVFTILIAFLLRKLTKTRVACCERWQVSRRGASSCPVINYGTCSLQLGIVTDPFV
jgi:hypothetical protein